MQPFHAEFEETAWRNSIALISILNPLIATALYSFAGLTGVIAVDLGSFLVAFLTLLFFIRIPENKCGKRESVLNLARGGLVFLKENPLVLTLILFMSGVNLVASAFDATLPGYVLPNPKGGFSVLGIVASCSGATLMMFILGVSGSLVCVITGRKLKKYQYQER